MSEKKQDGQHHAEVPNGGTKRLVWTVRDGQPVQVEAQGPRICPGGPRCLAWSGGGDVKPVQVEHLVHWDQENRRYQAYCCGGWWVHNYDRLKPGNYCHNGAHYIVQEEGK